MSGRGSDHEGLVVGPCTGSAGQVSTGVRRRAGPAGACATRGSVANAAGWTSQRLACRGGPGDADLNAATVEEFLAARRALGYVHFLSVKALNPLLEYLRQAGAAPLPVTMVAVTPAEALLERFHGYLTSERGLTAGTACNYVHLV